MSETANESSNGRQAVESGYLDRVDKASRQAASELEEQSGQFLSRDEEAAFHAGFLRGCMEGLRQARTIAADRLSTPPAPGA